jgi:hypothetical protein
MKKMKKLNNVQIERHKVKNYFISWALIMFTLILVYFTLSSFYIFCFDHSLAEDEIKKNMLLVFPPALATITAFIFAIPAMSNTKEYSSPKKITILIYLCWLVPNIIFPLLPLGNIFTLSEEVFRLCIVLFAFSLFSLIPYVTIFIQSSRTTALLRLFNFSASPFVFNFIKVNEKIIEKTKKRITALHQLILPSIHDYDNNLFSLGLEKLNALGKIILESPKLDDNYLNDIYKNIITNYQYISCECAKIKLVKYLRQAAFNISDLIKFGMTSKNQIALKIDYPILIKELEKAGVISVENNMHSVVSEIINYLGQIGEMSLEKNSDIPADIQVLSSLQEIGILCAEKKLETLCIEALRRILTLGSESAMLMESNTDSERKKEIEKILKKALSSHWIVSAYMFKHIPESGEWLKKLRIELKQEFGDNLGSAYNHALNEMELISSVGVKVLQDYKKAVKKTRGS